MSEARGPREKKTMERFIPPPAIETTGLQLFEGSGTKLGDIPIVPVMLNKVGDSDHDLLKALHSFLYGTVGKKTTRKKNIRSFSGFPEGDNRDARVNKLAQSKKWTLPALKDLCQLLGLEKAGDKADVVDRLVDFLTSPDPGSSKAPAAKKPKPAKKRKSAGKAKKAKKAKKEIKPRPLSGYFMFTKENRAKVLKDNPDLKFTEVAAKMGEMWRECSDAQKEKYKQKGIKEFQENQTAQPDEEEEGEENNDEGESEGEDEEE